MTIAIAKLNETYIRVTSDDRGIEQQLWEFFTFEVPGARFTPAYKNKIWDGKLRLYNLQKKTLYAGLYDYVKKFAEINDIEIIRDLESIDEKNSVTPEEIREFMDSLKLSARGERLEIREYQYDAVYQAILNKRILLLSPTSCLHGETLIAASIDNIWNHYTFRELYDLYNSGTRFRLLTPDGPKGVIGAYRKFGPGRKIVFDDGTETIGSSYHLVLLNDEYVTLESLTPGTSIQGKIVTSNESVPDDYWYDFSLEYEHECYIQNGLIHHNSGKSSLIYSIVRWILHTDPSARILIIVPVTNLVEQIYSDFEDYSSENHWSVADFCQRVYGTHSKEITHQVVISTWQSIYKWTGSDFANLGANTGIRGVTAAIVDEAHLMKAQSLTSILEKLTTTQYRIGLTGTLDGAKTSKLTIEGLTGPVYKVITTRQLMDDGHVSELKIKCILLEYSKLTRQAAKRLKYQDEIDFIVTNQKRNRVIIDLARACSGNTLILFQFVDKHGRVLYNSLLDKLKDSGRMVYFISGDTAATEREKIRKEIESASDAIIVGSYQTVSTGVNIPSLENVIFASPSKSRVRNLQSIGRGLRLKEGKSHCNLFDIADDLSHGKRSNYTLKHFMERIKIYSEEDFNFKVHKLQLESE